MGHTRFKKKKKRWATQKKWRGGATITKTKQVQQSFDTIHDFYSLERGLFKSGLDSNVSTIQQAYDAMVAANPQDPQIAQAQATLQQAQHRAKLYETMKKVMQYMIITLNSVTFDIPILQTIHTPQSINANVQLSKYTGNKKNGQLFFAGPNIPSSKVSTSGIEIQGREYFEIPPGREWPKLANAVTSYINLASLLFNLNDNPDQDTQNAYNLELGQPIGTLIPQGATLTDAHTIYMVCDAGANTYGKLAESVRVKSSNGKTIWDGTQGTLLGPQLIELVTPLTTADSASSNPYADHEFVFVASDADPDVFISDANLYTNTIYQIRYVRDQWNAATGLGFKLVISRLGSNDVLFELVYGILGEGQTPSVKPAGSKALPSIYNSQGPSAASLSGCALLRALNTASVAPGAAAPVGVFPDIDDEKIGKPQPLNPLSPHRVRDMVATAPIPGLPGATLREQIIHELMQIMTQQNGVSPLCGTANMVDPYTLLGNRFSTLPAEVWFDSKRGGDRDQVKALHMLSQQKNGGNLVYPFIHFVTGDELAAKMAVELGLAVIYQANGIIRYWPKMFRFRPESRAQALSLNRITTSPAPEATQGPWAIALWGGNQMKGGLRNPISEHISLPPYAKLEDKDGVQYIIIPNGSFLSSQNQVILPGKDGRPHIIISDLWFNPSKYVMMKEQIAPLVKTIPEIISEIKTNYDMLKQHIPQIPELPNIQMTEGEMVSLLNNIADGLSNIDYRTLDPNVRQSIIDVLQRIFILKPDNRGIYQYDFINAVRYNNDPQINVLDELTFKIVNESKEDDGLEGARLIGENSPKVTVTSDDGQHQWVIPALLDINLQDYDINFMVNRFLISVVLYCNNQGFTADEMRHGIILINNPFIINYGINPIVSYIRAKYDVKDNNLDGLKVRIKTSISSSINALTQPSAAASSVSTQIRSSVAQSSAAASSVLTPIRSFAAQPSAAASSVSTPIIFGQSTFSSNPTPPASFRPPPPPASNGNRIGIPFQSSSSPQSAFDQSPFSISLRPTFSTSLNPTPFAGFAQSSLSSSPPQSAFGQSPFSVSLGPTPSAAFTQPFSSSLGQAAPPLTLKLTRKASKNLPGQRTIKKGINAEEARRDRENVLKYLREKKRQTTVNSRRRSMPGGRRRTQKNHKRKKHGTQRKRSHKGFMRRLKDKGSMPH